MRARLAPPERRVRAFTSLFAFVGLMALAVSLATLPGDLSLWHAVAIGGGLALIVAMLAAISGTDQREVRRQQVRFEELGDRLERRLEQLQDIRWEINENEVRYRDLLDSQQELIVRRDGNGNITFVNNAFCRALSVEPKDVLGKPLDTQAIERDGPGPLTADAYERTRRYSELIETRLGPRWIEWEEQVLPGADGLWLEVQGVGRDMTERRRVEAELCETRDAAEAANRAKSRFLAAMSHEIRTPMNGILGLTSLLIDSPLTEEQRTYARAVDQSARTLLSLIDEILDFSKIEAGKLSLAEAPFELESCLRGAIALLAPKASEKGLTLSCTIAPDLPRQVVSDEGRLRQVMLNLIANAVKFTDKGRIDVTVTRNDVPAPTKHGQIGLVISVTDTGIGLSAEETRGLFTEFEQTDAAQQRHQGGTGLGLAISRQIARAMGGDITVTSSPGVGSTFVVSVKVGEPQECVPDAAQDDASTPSQAALAAVGRRPQQGGPPPRVLLAEDNAINALLAMRVLELSGCEVAAVTNGRQAVAAMTDVIDGNGRPFDLVLMDIFMPVLDGLEAVREIRAAFAAADPALRLPPIVALTANAFAEDRVRYLNAGFDDYLAKPFDKAGLEALIGRWLGLPVSLRNGTAVPAA